MRHAFVAIALLLALSVFARADDNWPPIGDLELPEYGSTVFETVTVSGWALDFEDAALTVNVLVDGQDVGQATYPSGDRPDIQDFFPDVAWSLHTGFAFSLDTRSYSNGSHRIRVTATDPRNETAVIGESVVTVDNTSTPDVRPWPDTTDGVYVFSDQIPDYITNQQAFFAATHYTGCQKIIRSFADSLRIYNPNFIVLHYRLGLGLGYRAPNALGQPLGDWLYIIEGNGWVREWPAAPQDQWFYPYGGSSKVYQNQWGWYLIDPDNSSWRDYWLGEVRRQLQTNDDDGLFADSFSVPNFMGGSTFTPNLPAYDPTFESAWSGKIARWIAAIKQDFGSTYKLIPNVGNWVTTRDTTDYSGADGVMVEGFAAWGQGVPFIPSDWQLQMDRILSLTSLDKIVIMQSYIYDLADLDYRKYLLANYLLVKGTKSYINIEWSMEPEWFPEYDVELGAPLSVAPNQVSELYRANWGVYARPYARGLVLVNPGNTARIVVVGSGYKRVTAVGGGTVPEDADTKEWHLNYESVISVTLPPGSAEILLRDGSTPAALSVMPTTGYSAAGSQGGPFSPTSASYVLANTGGLPLEWTASLAQSSQWLSVSPSSGTIGVGGQAILTVSLTAYADSLTPGTYQDTLVITNTSNGVGSTTRAMQLSVASPQPIGGFIEVSPLSGLASSGIPGGPFSPVSASYSVYNPGDTQVEFAVTHEVGENWLTIGHMLPGKQTSNVTVAVNSRANSLTPGTYSDTVAFTNLTNGEGNATRSAQLTILGGQLSVTPSDGLAASGYQGGPFTPASKQYTLTNTGGTAISWTATHGALVNWLSLSSASGVLNPGASTIVTASINSNANALSGGTYTDTISFTNTTNGLGNTTRPVQLVVSSGRLQVTPTDGFSSNGSPGGIFSPASCTYTLSNPGNSMIYWTVSHDPAINWLGISQTSGMLVAGGSALVTLTINANAGSLPAGTYYDTASFTNATNGVGNTTRAVTLTVGSRSLTSLELIPAALDCPSSDPRQICAIAHFSDSTRQDVTSVAQWASSALSVVTVSAVGLVTPVSQGSANVTCSYAYAGVTKTATCPVNVKYRTLYYLYMTPISRTFYQNIPYQFLCKARMSDGWLYITDACTWKSSDPSVATVDRHGLVTPVGNGVATISVSYVYNGVIKTARATASIWCF